MYAVTDVKIFRFMEGEGAEMCLLLFGISKFAVVNWQGNEQIVTKLSIYNIFVLLYLNAKYIEMLFFQKHYFTKRFFTVTIVY